MIEKYKVSERVKVRDRKRERGEQYPKLTTTKNGVIFQIAFTPMRTLSNQSKERLKGVKIPKERYWFNSNM